MTESITPIVADLQALLADHSINTCRFMRHWSSDRATRQHFEAWLKVPQLCASISFGWALKRIEVRMPKILCLTDEFRDFSTLASVEWWPSQSQHSHGGHFKKLASFLGFSIEVKAAFKACPPSMQAWLEFRELLAETNGPEAALLTLAVANEVGNLTLFKALKGALETIETLQGCPPDYIDAHLEDEGPDARIMISLARVLTERYRPEQYEDLRINAATATQRFLDLRLVALEEAYERFE